MLLYDFWLSGKEIDSTSESVFSGYHRCTIVRPQYSENDIVDIFNGHLNPRGVNCLKAPVCLLQLIQETHRKHFSINKIYKVLISDTPLEDVRLENEKDDIIRQTHTRAHRGIKENKIQILLKYFFPEI